MGFISGTADLMVDGVETGVVEYKLQGDPPKPDNPGHVAGAMYGAIDAIEASFRAPNGAWLRRHDVDYSMHVVVMSHTADGQSQITVTGSPGPWPDA